MGDLLAFVAVGIMGVLWLLSPPRLRLMTIFPASAVFLALGFLTSEWLFSMLAGVAVGLLILALFGQWAEP